jgi:peptide chain release factor 2
MKKLRGSSRKCEVIFDVDVRDERLQELEKEAASAGFWDDQARARENIDEANAIRSVVEPFNELASQLEDVGVLLELTEAEDDEGERKRALDDIQRQLKRAEKDLDRLEVKSLLSGKFDRSNAYLSLHAGAGGTESCDWAEMLFRMYQRYAEQHDFEIAVLDFLAGDEAGIKRVSFLVSGPCAYGYLKAERGVHRLVRISPFDSNKRRHTSFASLDVVPEVDESVDVEIAESDLRVDTYRASGAGGQHVNTTDSAVRITHEPTGIVVQCQAERSQHKNRSKAMQMLRAKVYEWQQDQKKKEMERFYSAKGEIAWGNQIRSYVLQPYTMAKDHRTDTEKGNVQAVLDGDLDEFIEAYLKHACEQEHS